MPSIAITIGQAILRARTARNMSQRELAHVLGVAQGTIWRWETGEEISAVRLVELARALRCSPRDFLPAR